MLSKVKTQKGESGILMPISSLPSKHGIGSFGIAAYKFIDFLKKSKQTYWQLLPLVPLGEGNSPYKSSSCFAGELLYIDLDFLVNDGLLNADDIPQAEFPEKTDYCSARKFKFPLIKKATENFNQKRRDYVTFLHENSWWLNDYAVFAAAIDETSDGLLSELDPPLKHRYPAAIEHFKSEHRAEIRFHKIAQFIFYSQFFALKEYAAKNDIKLIGDIPFYVSLDSAEVWKHPENFRLGCDLTPVLVAGVPPDAFSADGQLWGNPIYDWDFQRKNKYLWWRKRLSFCQKLYDVIRIDHFRAFASYYAIPFGATDAGSGTWEKGAGLYFWQIIKKYLGNINIIAEDLGGDEPEVKKLLKDTEFPNMKVLQFAFSGGNKNPFLPKNYSRNCVCYTGTHDNNTALGWYGSASNDERLAVNRIVPYSNSMAMPLRMISAAMRSKAALVIIPMQDWLCLGGDARMNTPGTKSGNWEWRMAQDAVNDKLINTIRKLTGSRN